jgi:hypothetical protein
LRSLSVYSLIILFFVAAVAAVNLGEYAAYWLLFFHASYVVHFFIAVFDCMKGYESIALRSNDVFYRHLRQSVSFFLAIILISLVSVSFPIHVLGDKSVALSYLLFTLTTAVIVRDLISIVIHFRFRRK